MHFSKITAEVKMVTDRLLLGFMLLGTNFKYGAISLCQLCDY